jgi:NAD(P)-dependent dehydrogenase (short-subunit alcohol dehydrogenase family)
VTGVAVVTGAGSGIGMAVALALCRAGWQVTFSGRNRSALDRAVQEATPDTARAVVVDVRNEASVHALFVGIEQRYGRLDLLFNNAGTFGPSSRIDHVALAEWQSVLDVNLTGSFLCARSAFDLMRRQTPQGGRIINNGSLSAHTPRPNSIAYSATKHAITGLTKSLALEGREFGIISSQIDIGNAATPMTNGAATGMRQADGSAKAEPMMEARHAADTVLYMAELPLTANAQFVTVLASGMPYIGRG